MVIADKPRIKTVLKLLILVSSTIGNSLARESPSSKSRWRKMNRRNMLGKKSRRAGN
jgi:hypothetical protein